MISWKVFKVEAQQIGDGKLNTLLNLKNNDMIVYLAILTIFMVNHLLGA